MGVVLAGGKGLDILGGDGSGGSSNRPEVELCVSTRLSPSLGRSSAPMFRNDVALNGLSGSTSSILPPGRAGPSSSSSTLSLAQLPLPPPSAPASLLSFFGVHPLLPVPFAGLQLDEAAAAAAAGSLAFRNACSGMPTPFAAEEEGVKELALEGDRLKGELALELLEGVRWELRDERGF